MMSLPHKSPPIVVTRNDHERLSELTSAALRQMPHVGEFLADELDRAQVVDADKIAPTVVTMHSRVEFKDDATGERRTITLVYPGEQDIAEGKVSILTPIGAALLGLSEGQSIERETPKGEWKSLTVVKLLFQPQAEQSRDALPSA
ncbi:nucleoside diphosphate kinase regulator [Rhodospirillaceae bacterium SYSU D60014]|jgi:regulator of nucleoside diphosphate kinase|uniref:nucleoside diphosphate kinase regulator n=1 Tax=Virgifigura deserti TaxID=2268457 RepID=UPI000E65F619